MTVNEIINKAWQDCGEPSDIDPTNTTDTSGLDFCVQVLNIAMDSVVQWKGFQGRRRTHFPDYITSGFAKNKVETMTVDYSTMDDAVLVIASIPSSIVPAVGDVVSYGGESRLVWYAGTEVDDELWLSSAFTNRVTDLSEADVEITIHQSVLAPGFTRFVEYLRVGDVSQSEVLPRMRHNQSIVEDITSVGRPEEWDRKGTGIIFDVAPDAAYLWRITYYGLPTLATSAHYTAGSSFDVPEEFHVAVLAYMKGLIYDQRQEPDIATTQYQRFNAIMGSIQGSWEQKNMISGTKQIQIRTA